MQYAERLMDAENRRDAGQHIKIKDEFPVLARRLDPVLICGARWQTKNELALLFGQPPEVGDGQEGSQAGRTQPTAIR